MFLYRVIIFLGSFLLFLVQPIIAKYFLPFFGGGSGIWIASVLFFMTMLFVGYLYSYWLTLSVGRRHKKIHLLVIIFSVGIVVIHSFLSNWVSPIMPQTSELFHLNNPMVMIMVGLLVSIGIPYFLLSTTSILVQYWASKTEDNPYDLYNYSNIGGLGALFCYPFIIEAYIPLSVQGTIWSILFIIYGILLLFLMWKAPIIKDNEEKIGIIAPFKGVRWILWILIAVLTSIILLTSTEIATRGVSAGPFAWLLPLVAYIASYVISFRNWKISTGRFIIKYAIFMSVGLMLYSVIALLSFFDIISHTFLLSSFFLTVMVLIFFLPFFFIYAHRILYLIRPKKNLLPFFYLCTAIGGVIGGIMVNIVAPVFFDTYIESSFAIAGFILLVGIKEGLAKIPFKESGYVNLSKRQIKYGFAMGLIFVCVLSLAQVYIFKNRANLIFEDRNFYGLVRVIEIEKDDGVVNRRIIHGNINHGEENIIEGVRSLPVAYYINSSGVGNVLGDFKDGENKKVGIIGLGAGGIAGYCNQGDEYVFYEIDKQVINVANEYFTYLKSCENLKVIYGDARIKLEEELQKDGSGKFNVLIMDAFSDDAIPVHLLTKEAFDLYNSHLAGEGVLLIHISNNFLDLLPIIKNQADRLNKKMVVVDNIKIIKKNKSGISSLWTILVDKDVTKYDKYHTDKEIEDVKLWTDDYSYIFDIIKW